MKTPPEEKASFAKRRPRLFLSLVAASFVFVLALNVAPSMLSYLSVSGALAQMNARVIKAEGIAIDKPRLTHGGFWWFQNLCIDNPCPTFEQKFLVPLEVGKEEAFMKQELLASLGYRAFPSYECHMEVLDVSCLATGSKGRTSVFMALDPVAKQLDRIPNKAVSPKVWRTLSISSYPL